VRTKEAYNNKYHQSTLNERKKFTMYTVNKNRPYKLRRIVDYRLISFKTWTVSVSEQRIAIFLHFFFVNPVWRNNKKKKKQNSGRLLTREGFLNKHEGHSWGFRFILWRFIDKTRHTAVSCCVTWAIWIDSGFCQTCWAGLPCASFTYGLLFY